MRISKLTAIANELASQGVNFRGLVLERESNKGIVLLARREKADLVVMWEDTDL